MIILGLLILIFFIYGIFEYHQLRIQHLKLNQFVNNKNIPLEIIGKKILFVSDFQFDLPFGLFNKRAAKKVFQAIEKEKPDLLILGGDYSDAFNYKDDHIFRYIKGLKFNTIAVLGNHDLKGSMKDITLSNLKNNSKVLINESFHYCGIHIFGLDDYRGKPDFSPRLDSNKINLIVSHRPDAFYDLKGDFDFMLSGHTHGGMISLFGKYIPITHNKYGQKLAAGLYREESKSIYVSRGVGGNVFGIPFRFFAKPEIVVMTFDKN